MTSSTSPDFFKDGTPKKRKARFSFTEVHILLDEVRKHRRIVVGKFNRGVPSALKKRTWAEITARINEIAECEREVSEVIRKWSDLKFDIKRKVRGSQAGSPGNQLQRQSPVDNIIRDILDLNSKQGRRQPSDGHRSNGSRRSDRKVAAISSGEEEDEVGEEDEDGDTVACAGSLHSSPEDGDRPARARGTGGQESSDATLPLLQSFKQEDAEHDAMFDSSGETSFEMSFEMPAIEDADLHDERPSSSSRLPTSATSAGNGSTNTTATSRTEATLASSVRLPSSSFPSLPAPSVRAAERGGSVGAAGTDVGGLAALSVQEQHMGNALLETVSRSLELLAESLQTLAETQQEFMRESLRLQTDTVQVLRDFASSAMTLMQDKLNGRPTH
ncbi:hypothetical protein ACEWY4_008901 [Coilia grayii]|uniref:Myb/SANT-like DNA-binding domain-containing protein n=1 Tax=Coilia grayii TaxID=363190 RepID=A0ABD1K4Z0_9TELE